MRKHYNYVAFAAILSMLNPSGVAAQPAPSVSNQEIYESLYDELMIFLTGNKRLDPGKAQVQLVPEFIDADWAELEADTNADIRAFSQGTRCNILPLRGDVYSDSEQDLWDEYLKYLQSIKFPKAPGASDANSIETARSAWQTATTTLQARQASVFKAYQAWRTTELAANRTATLQAYYAQTGEGQMLGVLQQDVLNKATAYFTALGNLGGSYQLLGKQLVEMSDFANHPPMPAPGGLSIKTPTAAIVPQIKPWVAGVGAMTPDANGIIPNNGTLWRVKKGHAERKITTFSASAGGGGGLFGFFRGDANGGTTTTVNVDDNFEIVFSFKATGKFTCSRHPWFDGGLLKAFRKPDNFLSGDNALIKDPIPYFFGANGTLRLVPTTFLVVLNPRMTITLSHADYQRVQSDWKASASYGFGPFKVAGGSANGTSDSQIWNDSTNTITLAMPSTHPVIMAVYSEINAEADKPADKSTAQ